MDDQYPESLLHDKESYRLLMENIKDYAIIMLDPGGYITSWNVGAESILGYQPADIIGRSATCIFTSEDIDNHVPEQEMARSVTVGRVEEESWHVCKDGTQFWGSGVLTALRDQTGQLRGFLKIVRDCTEPKRAESERTQLLAQEQAARAASEAAQRASETARNQVTTILESITDGFIAVDKEWRYAYVNQQAETLLARTREELLGQNVWAEFPEVVGTLAYRESHRAMSEQVSVEFEQFCPPLNTWVEVRIYPSQEGLSSYLRDISKRKQAEEVLQQQAEREQLVAAIAQRIRQSLNLEEILNTTVSEVRQFLQTDRIFIYRFEPDWSGVVVAESVGSDWKPILGSKLKDLTFAETYVQPYKQGRIQATADIYTAGLSQCYIDFLVEFQARAALVVPILQGEVLWGLLCANCCLGPRQWQPLEIDLLKQLATQVGIAIHQAELYQQAQVELADRKQAEAALQESQAHLNLTLQAATLGSWQLDLTTEILTPSDQCKANFGLSPEADLSYQRLFELIHPEDRDRVQTLVRQALDSHTDYRAEYRCRWANGSIHWLFVFGRPIYAADGTPLQMDGITLDITERKQAEQAIQFQANLLNQVRNAVVCTDREGHIIYWNRFAETLYGWSAAEVVGRHVGEVTPTKTSQAQAAEIMSCLKHGESWAGEFLVQHRDGTTFPVLVTDSPIYDEKGDFVGMVGISSDITERRQAEQKIRDQAALLDVATDAVCVQDLENQILFWNQGAERLYRWQAEEALGKNAEELLYREEGLPQLEVAIKALGQRGEWQGELDKVTKTSEDVIVLSHWTLVRDEAGQPKSILMVDTNITEKKQLEKQVLRTQRLESLGTLAGGIAHDLNNILTPILAVAQLLPLKFPDADKQCQELFQILEPSAKRGAALVKQILSFARGIEGKRTILQVKHLITEIKQIVKETFPKSIEFYSDIAQDLWLVNGDITQLHQVLMNLCVNARDAMPRGGTLSLFAENLYVDEHYARMILEAKVGPYIVITVADTGTGMPPEIVDRIFEPFFTTKELGKGTGLGLSIVIGIIKSHGGFVNVTSKVGKGTQFKVFLPAETKTTSTIEDLELPTGQGELVLVIDDEAPIREITKTSLETFNYKVLTASDGIEAISLYAQSKDEINVVLVDMMMPSMDGSTTIHILRKMNPQVKVVAVSGLMGSDQLAEAASVRTFLSKPYTTKELLQALHEVLSNN